MKADLTATANFAIDTFTLAYSAGANSKLEGITSQTVAYGSTGTAVGAVPYTGYHFVSWSDGSTDSVRVDKKVTADLSVTVAYGSVFVVNASDLEDSSAFAKVPKVGSSGGGKVKGMGFKKGSDSVNCVWQGKDKPGTYALLVNGETLTPDTGVANDKITVTGSYFGSTCPKVTMERSVEGKAKPKKAICKVVKPYEYDDANNKPGKSVMYVGQEASESGDQPGDSELTFVVPKGITESITAKLKLNCNGTIVERKLNPTK